MSANHAPSLCHISIQADMSGGSPEASDLIKTEINLIWDLLEEYDKSGSGLMDPDTYRRSRLSLIPDQRWWREDKLFTCIFVLYIYFLLKMGREGAGWRGSVE